MTAPLDLMNPATDRTPAPECPDCLDIAFALGDIQLAAKFLKDRFVNAAEDELDPNETLRARLPELRQLQAAVNTLLADVEIPS